MKRMRKTKHSLCHHSLNYTYGQFLTILTIFWQFLTILTIFCQLLLIMTMTMTRHENESSKDNDKDNLRDLWDINHSWESEFRTIWVTWQLRVTQDSICNSCDVLKHSAVWSAQKMPQIRRLSKNLKLSSTHVNLKTCSEFPQIGVCLSGSLQATQTHAMSQRGEAVAVCVTWADLLSGYQLLWKTFFSCNTFSDKRKLETKHLYLGQPHSWPGHTSHWYQISCFPER